MRTLFRLSLLGLFGAAALHCSADGTVTPPEDVDAGGRPIETSPVGDAAVDTPDVDAGNEVVDAGNCSADNWCRTPLPGADISISAVWSFAADDAIAATNAQLLHWDGTAWTNVNAPAAERLTSLWASSPNDVWGVARFGHRLAHGTRASVDQPFTWSEVEFDSESSPSMEIIRGAGTNELWVYGKLFGQHVLQHGIIATETGADGGSTRTVTWSTVPIDVSGLDTVNSFWVTEGKELWLAGLVAVEWLAAGAVLLGVPSAEDPNTYTWSEALSGGVGDFVGLTAIWGQSASELWSIGNLGKNYRGGLAGDGGVEWSSVPSNARTTMLGIWGSGPSDIWVVGSSGGVRHWDGATWRVSRLAIGGLPMWQDLTAVHGGPGGDVWAVGTGVALHRASGGSP